MLSWRPVFDNIPRPCAAAELAKYLGKTYNAWHIAIPLLESHVLLFPDESRCGLLIRAALVRLVDKGGFTFI